MSWLDSFFQSGYKQIQIAGVPLIGENIVNFVSGVTGVDNPALARTDLTVSGGGGSATITWTEATGATPTVNIAASSSFLGVWCAGVTTSAGTINLPASPTAGQIVFVTDEDGTGVSIGMTIQGNGNNIVAYGAGAASYSFSTATNGYARGATLQLSWIASASVWKVL